MSGRAGKGSARDRGSRSAAAASGQTTAICLPLHSRASSAATSCGR
ncbi:hypothetical protein OV079_47585 [Nannocystis pusilla]|uniref:Uncharacterized protein n=1 Tax=Nannocystis pusilla TaxID=889268 RepID=A0A9X3EZ71_9BACT|nr:hypothetical protein [Nannocystis pusilla]MCY1013073.1 hypothetical protein [Nannocystis pusilla]